MRTRLLMALLLVIAVGLMVTGCSNKKLIEQKDAQIVALQDEIDKLEGQVKAETDRNEQLRSDLEKALSDMRKKEQVWINEKENLTQVTLDGEVTFASGSTRITSEGKEILNRVFEVVEQYPDRAVMIEGHTDNVPIAERWQYRFRSNWELSSARANSVRRYVLSSFNIGPQRIGAVGYGEYRPIATNDTEEGRAANRRVVITIAPMPAKASAYP
jgi:chemotaxis protein MotB